MTRDLLTIDPDGSVERLMTAAHRLAAWGFLADPDLPDRPGPASLIVALRDAPTLRHYDPEVVHFWSSDGSRGMPRSITRGSAMPLRADLSWGEIRIVDRLGESNEYFTFGGACEADVVGGVTIAVFTSPAPLLRRGGHSQGWDAGADVIGAFFGRCLLAVDYVPGFEAELADASPLARYAAFLQDSLQRHRRITRASGSDRPLLPGLRQEAAGLERDDPAAWRAGAALLERMGPA